MLEEIHSREDLLKLNAVQLEELSREIRELLAAGADVITLGHRILRTDTAGIAVLSMLMLQLEED